MTYVPFAGCRNCGQPLAPGTLACPRCGGLVHQARLQQLSTEAVRLEQAGNFPAAAMLWRQCLELLPPDSSQYEMIYGRIGALASGFSGSGEGATLAYAPAAPPGNDTLAMALVKTIGSMAICIAVYWFLFYGNYGGPRNPAAKALALYTSLGFVGLILVHELGHVWAMRHYKLSAGPPIFIPFMGAVINLRQQPPNAKVESIVGIGGPALGTAGALLCFAIYLFLPVGDVKDVFLFLTVLGAFLNLFNLLPVPPLDGGRVTAAVSPWLWMLGLAALVGWVLWDIKQYGSPSFMKLLILFFAWPRIKAVFQGKWHNSPYYDVSSRTAWVIGGSYLGLGLLLAALFVYANYFASAEGPIINFL